MVTVEIFADRCPSCLATVEMTRAVAATYPGIDVRVVDVRQDRARARRTGIIVVPTVVIGGRVTFVGPPTREQLEAAIERQASSA